MRRVKSASNFQQQLLASEGGIDSSQVEVEYEDEDNSTHKSIFRGTAPKDLLLAYRTILEELYRVKSEVKELRQHVRGLTEESSQFTLKYSRRILMVSNILLAAYIIGERLVVIFQHHSKTMIRFMINPLNWISFKRPPQHHSSHHVSHANQIVQNLSYKSKFRKIPGLFNRKPINTKRSFQSNQYPISTSAGSSLYDDSPLRFQLLMFKLLWKALLRSGLLIFGTYWLTQNALWKRNCGLLISFLSSVHLIFTSDVSPWTIYFNMFSLLLYITARYYKHIPNIASDFVDIHAPIISKFNSLRRSASTMDFRMLRMKNKNSEKSATNPGANHDEDDNFVINLHQKDGLISPVGKKRSVHRRVSSFHLNHDSSSTFQ